MCVCFSFSSRLSCLISRCSKFVLQHFTKCEKSIQFHSHSMSFCLIFVLQMEKMSVWNVFAMFPMSIYSISFHFSFASNITKMEFRTLKLAKQICTYTYIVLCKMWFHFFSTIFTIITAIRCSVCWIICVFFHTQLEWKKKQRKMCYPAIWIYRRANKVANRRNEE